MSFLFASSVVRMFVISLSSRFSVCRSLLFWPSSSSRIRPFSRLRSRRCDAWILSISYFSSARSLSLRERQAGAHAVSAATHHSARTASKSLVRAAWRTSSVVLVSALNNPKAASCRKVVCGGEAQRSARRAARNCAPARPRSCLQTWPPGAPDCKTTPRRCATSAPRPAQGSSRSTPTALPAQATRHSASSGPRKSKTCQSMCVHRRWPRGSQLSLAGVAARSSLRSSTGLRSASGLRADVVQKGGESAHSKGAANQAHYGWLGSVWTRHECATHSAIQMTSEAGCAM